jgi:transcriptional regulator GlxA family with amidase domain
MTAAGIMAGGTMATDIMTAEIIAHRLRRDGGQPMNIVVVGSEGCLASSFVGLVDMLWLARRAIAGAAGDEPPFDVTTASLDGGPIMDGNGRRLEIDTALERVAACAAVLVPSFMPDRKGRPPSLAALGPIGAWIRRQHAYGAIAGGTCSGVFLLGEAGLLDARRCTTTWWLYDEMKRRYPRAEAVLGSALIEDRRVVSAGGPLSWIDLVVHVVRALCGPEAARRVADFAVVDAVPSTQAIYVPTGHLAASNPFLVDAERVVREAAAEPLTARDLARRLATSERTLHRRLKKASGESPKTFIDRIRCETASLQLETSDKSVKQVVAGAGYSDDASFRRAFKRFSGMTPGAYRLWARTRRAAS